MHKRISFRRDKSDALSKVPYFKDDCGKESVHIRNYLYFINVPEFQE